MRVLSTCSIIVSAKISSLVRSSLLTDMESLLSVNENIESLGNDSTVMEKTLNFVMRSKNTTHTNLLMQTLA